MKKILVIQPTINQTGGGSIAQNYITLLLKELDFEVYTMSFCKTESKSKNHYSKDFLKKYDKKKDIYWYNKNVYKFINDTITKINPEVIILGQFWSYISLFLALNNFKKIKKIHIVHTAGFTCLNSLLIKKNTKEPCKGSVGLKCLNSKCVTIRNSPLRIGMHYIVKLFTKKSFNHFICHSRFVQNLLKKEGYKNSTLIPLMIPEKIEYHNAKVEKENTSLNLLFVGVLEWAKGILEIFDSIVLLKEKSIDFHFQIVGEGSLRPILEKIIIEKRLQTFVTLVGAVSRSEIFKYYQNTDIVVFPSYFETFGLVPLEAMLHNKKLIISNRGALPEITFGYKALETVTKIEGVTITEAILRLKSNNIIPKPKLMQNNSATEGRRIIKELISKLLQK